MAVDVASKVGGIYPDHAGCYISLKEPAHKPKMGYFRLPLSHPNYNSLYALAVVAAVNGYTLHIRTVSDIVGTEFAEVGYMVVMW